MFWQGPKNSRADVVEGCFDCEDGCKERSLVEHNPKELQEICECRHSYMCEPVDGFGQNPQKSGEFRNSVLMHALIYACRVLATGKRAIQGNIHSTFPSNDHDGKSPCHIR